MTTNWKLVLLGVLIFFSLDGNAQMFNYVTEAEYAQLKSNGLLTGNEVVQSDTMVKVNPNEIYQEFIILPKAQGCGGYFDPPGPSLPVTALDDGWLSASPIALPFTFCFFGDQYNQVWMNNNGNISFAGGISAFSSNAFPSVGNEMIAAYWADFDLGGTGTMHATVTPTAAVFNWVQTGYFSSQIDKVNTCQIVITDGTDPLVIAGNAAIHYDDMQWTTGSASNGVNGFGGIPATAGANRGNGIDYFQIGRFDHAGTDYDGPNGINDGVSWLDYKSFFFDFCTAAGGNMEPIPLQTGYCDTFEVCTVGDTIQIAFPFLSPENNQITTVSYTAPTLQNETIISNVAGSSGEITIQVIGALETVGIHEIVVTAIDNFAQPASTTVTYWLEVIDGSQVFAVEPELSYTVACAPVTFDVANGPYDGYLWENGSTANTYTAANAFHDTLSVIVEKSGCRFKVDSLVYVPGVPSISLTGSPEYCAGTGGSLISIVDSTTFGSITWGLTDPVQDASYSNMLPAGTYTVQAYDSLNLCPDDTTFTIVEIPGPSISVEDIACNFGTFVNGTTSSNGGYWMASDTAVHFNPNNGVDNPEIWTTTPGTYTVTYTDSMCGISLTETIDFPAYPWTWLEDTTICAGVTLNLTALNENEWSTTYSWSNGAVGESIQISAAGTYYLTMENVCHTNYDSIVVDVKLCDIIVPNVISLAQGTHNPLWYVTAEGVSDFSLVITNRWGNVVYECNDVASKCIWDGRNKGGETVSEGTYFYTIRAQIEGGETLDKHGFIQVVK